MVSTDFLLGISISVGLLAVYLVISILGMRGNRGGSRH